MKLNFFRSLAFVSVLLLGAATASAHDFEVDGIFYNENSDGTTVSVTYKGDTYNSYTNEYTGAVVIPASVTYSGKTYSVTAIGNSAFYRCSGLTSVVIPNSVTQIDTDAFYKCSGLTSVEIPNSVTSIGKNAFWDCSSLTKVNITDLESWCKIGFETTNSNPLNYAHRLYLNGVIVTDLKIPNSITAIGKAAFYGCSHLKSVTIPNSVTSIGNSAFGLCYGLMSVTIPNSVTSIGSSAFNGCHGLTSVVIPNSVTTIGDYAFYDCIVLTSVEIPNSVTTIGNSVFYRCSGLTSVVIPNSVTSIGDYAFCDCSGLTSVEIPNSVTSIGSSAFNGCSGLTSVVIGNSVTSIGDYAFSGCSGLKSITSLNTTPPKVGSNVFDYVPSDCVLYVPAGSKNAYSVADGWSRFTDIRELPAGVDGTVADDIEVRVENGVIRIEGVEGAAVEVYNAAGVCIYSGVAAEVPVPQRGIYVVKVAGRATKLAL